MSQPEITKYWVNSSIEGLISTDGIISDGDWIESKDQDPNGAVRLIQLADIGDGNFRNKSERFMSTEKAALLNCTFLREGDVLVARMPDPLGRACIFPGVEQPSVTVVDICLIRTGKNSAISQNLLKYWINSPVFRNLIAANASGTTRKRITRKKLEKFEVPLPPLAEQKVIADKLDALLAQVESTKARLDQIPQILKRFRQSVLAAAVSGRLTAEWRKQNHVKPVYPLDIKIQHQKLYLAKNQKYKEPVRFKKKGASYKLPHSWEWFRAEELCDLITKGTTPKKNEMSLFGSIPFIKVYNLTFNGELDFSIDPTYISQKVHDTDLKRSKVYPGDVLMNIVGPPLGKVSIVPNTFPEWNLNQAISIFRPLYGAISNYLALCLRDEHLLDQTKAKAKATAGQFNLTLEICRDYPVPLPPLEEQTEIVSRVDQLFAYADRIEQQVNNAQERVNNLTQSILAKAFRGELTEQWRKDNPELISGDNSAEALLERIKAERAALKPAKRSRKKAGV